MIIAVDLRPEVETELARQAGLRGRPVEVYVAKLLDEDGSAPSRREPPCRKRSETSARWCA
jgi:hypothetical protein